MGSQRGEASDLGSGSRTPVLTRRLAGTDALCEHGLGAPVTRDAMTGAAAPTSG
jgi:hypothetical protein